MDSKTEAERLDSDVKNYEAKVQGEILEKYKKRLARQQDILRLVSDGDIHGEGFAERVLSTQNDAQQQCSSCRTTDIYR